MKDFYELAAEVDLLDQIKNPTVSDCEKLKALIQDDDDLAYYFFNEKGNPAWVKVLSDGSVFGDLEEPEPKALVRAWGQARYLLRIAEKGGPEVQSEVAQVIRKAGSQNQSIQYILLSALLEMPAPTSIVAAEAVPGFVKLRRPTQWGLVGQPAAKLMVRFCPDFPEQAFRIAQPLLEVWSEPREKLLLPTEAVTRFTAYEYEELVFTHYSHLWEAFPYRAVTLLVRLLHDYAAQLGDPEERHVFTGRYATLDEVERAYEHGHDITYSLLGGIIAAGKALMSKEADKTDDLLNRLLGSNVKLSQRLAMHLLRFVPKRSQVKRINAILSDRRLLDSPYCRAEYKWLLHDKSGEISPQARSLFGQWVEGLVLYDEQSLARLREEGHIREATDQQIASWNAQHRARELYPLRDLFPALFDRYRDEAQLSEKELEPRPSTVEAGFVPPTAGSPLAEEEAARLEPGQVIDFALDRSRCQGKRDAFSPNTPEEGLGGVLEAEVMRRPRSYLSVSHDRIADLRPQLLMNFTYALERSIRAKKLEQSDWPVILGLLESIVAKRDSAEEYKDTLQGVLSILREGVDERSLLMPLDETSALLAWRLARRLLDYAHDTEPVVAGDVDLFTEGINVVQGKAIEFLIRLTLVSKEKAESLFARVLKGRLREALGHVVEAIRVPRVYAVIGTWLSALLFMDEEWATQNLNEFLSEDEDALWNAAWCSYLSWGTLWKRAFEALREAGKYDRGVRRLGTYPKQAHAKAAEEALAEHIAKAYFQAWIPPDDPLLTAFLETASAKLRGHAATYLSTAFESLKNDPDPEFSARATDYWRGRVEAIEHNPEEGFEEAVAFLRWIKDAPAEPAEAFALLELTLDATQGNLGDEMRVADFVEGICQLAPGHELAAVQCLLKAVGEQQKLASEFYAYRKSLDSFMERLTQLRDDYPGVARIRRAGMDLANAYGRMGNYTYRPVFEALTGKPKQAE